MAPLTMVMALNQAMRQALQEDPRVVILGQDIGRNGGVFRATEGLLEQFGANRVIDTPLSESAMVGTAIGMAAYGLRPVVEIQFAGFLYPALDQLAAQAARLRSRSAGRFTVPLVVRSPYGAGVRAPELHSDSIETLFLNTPGLKVVVPSTPVDAKGLLLSAIDDPDPVLFLEPMPLYRAFREEVPEEPYRIPLGQARIARPGRHVTVVAWGAMVPVAVQAASEAAHDGLEAEVIDLRTLNPLDEATLLGSVERTGRLVVVHEAPGTYGPGAELAALVAERALYWLQAPPVRVAAYDVPYPPAALERAYVPDVARVRAGLEEVMKG